MNSTQNPKSIKKLSVMMPVYNESRTLRSIVAAVLAAPIDREIELVAVDDGSTDNSLAILRELAETDDRIKVQVHSSNRGKGAAIRTAIGAITGDVAIVQDSDLEYDPADYPKLLKPILDGHADAVYGSRFAASEVRRVLFFWHALGNKVLTAMSNMANDLNLTDMETCYKAIRTDVLKELRLTSDRFGIEPEITARLAQWGARIYEVPISYHGRTYAEGKNIGWRDGVQALWLIFKFRFLDTRATDRLAVASRQSLGRARRYRRWLWSQFAEHVGDQVIEFDAGPGHLTSLLLDRASLVAADGVDVHVETLRRRFGHMDNFAAFQVDLDAGLIPDELIGRFDSVVLFDVLQRSADPQSALERAAQAVRPGGSVLIHVPADPTLFGPTDESVGHLRRFSGPELIAAVEEAGLELLWLRPFNRLGRMAWQLLHRIRTGRISGGQSRVFDVAVPVAKLFESESEGLSLIAVARVP